MLSELLIYINGVLIYVERWEVVRQWRSPSLDVRCGSKGDLPGYWHVRSSPSCRHARERQLCADCVEKLLFADDRKFSEPLVRLIRSDARDHIIHRKNAHWCSYRFYGALQWLNSPTCDICENFEAPRFSSFSTQSATTGRSISLIKRHGQDPSTQRVWLSFRRPSRLVPADRWFRRFARVHRAFVSGGQQTIGRRGRAATLSATPPTSAGSNHPEARPRSAAPEDVLLPNQCARHAMPFRPTKTLEQK